MSHKFFGVLHFKQRQSNTAVSKEECFASNTEDDLVGQVQSYVFKLGRNTNLDYFDFWLEVGEFKASYNVEQKLVLSPRTDKEV